MKVLKIAGGMLMAILVLTFFYNWGKSNATNTVVEDNNTAYEQPHKCTHVRKRVAHVAKRVVETGEAENSYEPRERNLTAQTPTVINNVQVNNYQQQAAQPVATSAPASSYPTIYVNGYGQVPYANGYVYIGNCWRSWGNYGGYYPRVYAGGYASGIGYMHANYARVYHRR